MTPTNVVIDIPETFKSFKQSTKANTNEKQFVEAFINNVNNVNNNYNSADHKTEVKLSLHKDNNFNTLSSNENEKVNTPKVDNQSNTTYISKTANTNSNSTLLSSSQGINSYRKNKLLLSTAMNSKIEFALNKFKKNNSPLAASNINTNDKEAKQIFLTTTSESTFFHNTSPKACNPLINLVSETTQSKKTPVQINTSTSTSNIQKPTHKANTRSTDKIIKKVSNVIATDSQQGFSSTITNKIQLSNSTKKTSPKITILAKVDEVVQHPNSSKISPHNKTLSNKKEKEKEKVPRVGLFAH